MFSVITVRKQSCVARGHMWQAGMRGRGGVRGKGRGGGAWQERRPLQRTVRILLECILVFDDTRFAKFMLDINSGI